MKKILPFLLAVLCLAGARSAQAATISKPANNFGLVGYWSFDEGAGTIAHDFSGHGNHGTLVNSPTWVDGKKSKSLRFNGSSSYVKVEHSSSLEMTTNVTVSAWIKRSSATYYGHVVLMPVSDSSWNQPYIAYGLQYHDTTNTIKFVLGYDDNNLTTNDAVTPDNDVWFHAVGTYDGHYRKLYINGVEVSSVAETRTLISTSARLNIGMENTQTTYPFNGILDDVRIYNRALSASDVKALYDSGAVKMNVSVPDGVTSGLVGHWTFDGKDVTASQAFDTVGGNTANLISGAMGKKIGKLGQAWSGDGWSQMTLSQSINLANTPFTATGWIYKYDSSDGAMFGSLGGGVNLAAHWGVRSSQAYFGNYGADVTGNQTISPGKWYHLAFLMDNDGKQSIYINGQLDAGPALTAGFYQSVVSEISGSCCIARLNGALDDLRIYNRALTANEIKKIYEAGATKVNTTQKPANLETGLVGHWTFDGKDMTATQALDSSGNGNNGTLVNAPARTVGKIGQGLKFAGTNYITINDSTFPSGSQPFSISLWAKIDGYSPGNYGTPFSYGTAVSGSAVIVAQNGMEGDGRIRIGQHSNDYLVSTNALVKGQWGLVTLTYNGTVATVYIDGVYSGNSTITLTTGLGSGMIGGLIGASQLYSGSLDDVRIYNRALSASEVRQLYLMGK